MRVTVCELPGDGAALEDAWAGLTEHVTDVGSDLVLLPEMPFHRWLPLGPEPSASAWLEAVETHRRWTGRLPELAPAAVAATRPVVRGGRRRNEGFEWAGRGWIVGPDGEVLGVTSADEPWLTREVDPGVAEAAKETYPRYVEE